MGAVRNIVATMIGTRIATEAKSTGLIGVVAGLAATRVIARSPLGALVVGGGYIAHKLLQKKQKADLIDPQNATGDKELVKGSGNIPALPALKRAHSKTAPAPVIAPAKKNATLTEGP